MTKRNFLMLILMSHLQCECHQIFDSLLNHTVLLCNLEFGRFDSSCPLRFTFLSFQLISECYIYFKISLKYMLLLILGVNCEFSVCIPAL